MFGLHRGALTLSKNQNPNPEREKLKSQIAKVQTKHMVYRVSSYFPKDGHSATQTEPKIIGEIEWDYSEWCYN